MKKIGVFGTIIRGCAMGIAEVIPGVSGGTMAVLLNIYDKFIGSISNIRKDFKNSIAFLIPLLIGMGLGIFGFSFVITYLNEKFPLEINFLFLGLVIGLFPMILRKSLKGGFKIVNFIAFIALFAFMIIISYFSLTQGDATAIVSSHSVWTIVKYIAVGALAAVCMILPGVSGSMIMLIFGIYFSVMEAIKTLNVLFLIPLAIGVLVGILYGAKLVDVSIRKAPQATYFGILGLLVGSTLILYCNNIVHTSKYVLDLANKGVYEYGFADFKTLLIHAMISIIILCVGFFTSYYFTRHED